MINAQDEREEEVLDDNETTDETEFTSDESEEVSEESVGEEAGETDEEESVSISRAELEKLRRESAAAKRLREKVSKKTGEESGESPQGLDQELISRTYLAAQAGIKDKEVQDEALRLAEKFGMNIAQAIGDPDISTRLTNLQKRKEAQRAVAKSTGGSSSRTKDAAYYLEYFKKNGDFPSGTPTSMIAKVTEILGND